MTHLPVSFTQKASASAKGGGYPVQISASDLDENFIYATLDIPERDSSGRPQPWITTQVAGPSGKRQRQLIFSPPPPTDGATYVLAFSGNGFKWLPTEEC
jgi:hypothetical protein